MRADLDVDDTLAIAEQVLSGLAAAHELGPGASRHQTWQRPARRRNMGGPCLADFGLVKLLETSATGQYGDWRGDGHRGLYLSRAGTRTCGRRPLRPVFDGSAAAPVAVGAIAIRGRQPHGPDLPARLRALPPSCKPSLPDVPAELAQAVARLLAKSPADRHQTADEVLADLRAIRRGEGVLQVPGRGRAVPTTIVRLPAFDEEPPQVPAELAVLQPPKWWSSPATCALSMFRRHAPEVLLQLQNTQQQVDGAVAVYECRHRDLQNLADAAESLLVELKTQARAQRSAAHQAEQRAQAAVEPSDRERVRDEQSACERAAEELKRGIADQQEQFGPIRLRLAQAQARLQELRNQRQAILNVRLLAARAERHLATGGRHPAEGRIRRIGLRVALALLAAFTLAAWIYKARTPAMPDSSLATNVSSSNPTVEPATGDPASRLKADRAVQMENWTSQRKVEKHLALSQDGTLLAMSLHIPAGHTIRGGAPSKVVDEIKLWNLATGGEVTPANGRTARSGWRFHRKAQACSRWDSIRNPRPVSLKSGT